MSARDSSLCLNPLTVIESNGVFSSLDVQQQVERVVATQSGSCRNP